MSRRFTPEEDAKIVGLLDVIGAGRLSCDLGRTVRAIDARAKRLKEVGAWDEYYSEALAAEKARYLAGHFPQDVLSERAFNEVAAEGRL